MSKFYCDACDFHCRKKHYFQNHINKCNYSIKKEHNKLFTLKKDQYITIGQGNNNIAHDFHELIFHIIFHFQKLSIDHIKSLNLLFILNDKMIDWSKYIITMICDYYNIKIKYTPHYVQRFPISIGYKQPGYRYLRDIKKYRNYLDCIQFLNELANKTIGQDIEQIKDKKWKVLYTRSDCNKRQLLNYQLVIPLFDQVIENMNIDAEEQIKIFQKATHFVTVGGANLTNIIFMNKSAKVLDIFTNEIDHNTHYIILACDGLWDVINNNEIPGLLNKFKNENKENLAAELSKEALKRNSTDNISIIIIEII